VIGSINSPDAGSAPAQRGLIVFTEKHFSVVFISGDKPRPEFAPARTGHSFTFKHDGDTLTMVEKRRNATGELWTNL